MFSTFHNVLQSWYHGKGKRFVVGARLSLEHRFCHENREDLEIVTILMIRQNGQTFSGVPPLP
jgi:hypothetical protein